MTAPLYESIEFCSSAEALWGKLDSDRWDWLGVNTRGDYVLGSPPLPRTRVAASLTVKSTDAETGDHGVIVSAPLENPSPSWFATEDEAIAAFDEEVARLEALTGSHIYRVVRIEGTFEVDTHFVAKVESNYR